MTIDHTTATLPILTAVNGAFQSIRVRHPEVPNLSIVLGASGAKRGGQVHGHFQANAWYDLTADDDNGGVEHGEVHEIFLSGESLERGAEATLATLLHEAAHALAYTRGVRDTSNAGRYHNKKFKAVAEELGILVEQGATIGWSVTRLSTVSYLRYAHELEVLRAALAAYRLPDYSRTPKPRRKTKMVMDCGCDKPVTVSRIWFEDAAQRLTCQDCLEGFHEVEEDE